MHQHKVTAEIKVASFHIFPASNTTTPSQVKFQIGFNAKVLTFFYKFNIDLISDCLYFTCPVLSPPPPRQIACTMFALWLIQVQEEFSSANQ